MPTTAQFEDSQTLRQEVLAANLRYGSVAEPLRTRAYAQVIVKVLFLAGKGNPLSIDVIQRRCRDLLNDSTPSRSSVEDALALLEKLKMIRVQGQKYQLVSKEWERLKVQIESRRNDVAGALQRHFSRDFDEEVLRRWFDAVAVEFFTHYGDKWVASATKSNVLHAAPAQLEEIVKNTAEAHGLEGSAETLALGFRNFIRSQEPEDVNLKWHYGRAMFAARLMAADLAADPISSKEFVDSTLLIDTNVLLEMCVEHSTFAASWKGVATAFAQYQVQVYYLPETQEEYEAVIESWRDSTLSALSKYGYSVVKNAQDSVIALARKRGVVRVDEFQEMFDELERPRAMLEDVLPIQLMKDTEILDAARQGANDQELVQDIQRVWREQRRYARPKTDARARHDAALTMAVRTMRSKGRNAWVLTKDLTMQDLANRWAGPNDTPMWITLDTVLQVLAVDEDGVGGEAAAFGPLLSLLIAAEVESGANELAYTVEDLEILDSYIRDSEGLPEEEIQELARTIRRRRLAGAQKDDPELRLAIERTFRGIQRRLGTDLEAARQRAAEEARAREEAERGLREQSRRSSRLEERLVKIEADRIFKARMWRLRAILGLVMLFVFWGAWALSNLLLEILALVIGSEGLVNGTVVEVALGLASILFGYVKLIRGMAWPRYVAAKQHLMDEALEQARQSVRELA